MQAHHVADPALEDEVRVIREALRDALRYNDDGVARGWLQLKCRMAGYPLDTQDARDLIRAARRRPHLRVIR